MSTATAVPQTRDELEGDEALETLRDTGWRRLVIESVTRFRAADGFSHSRALAFQFTLTLLPGLIAVVGLAEALDQETFRRVVQDTINALAPGAVGDILTEALRQGSTSATRESGETALAAGLVAAVAAGTGAMAQVERGANRIYGVERDRPFFRKYVAALFLALSAGLLALLSVVLLIGGSAIRDALGRSESFDAAWSVARWPAGLAFAVASISILFEYAPRRRQPEASWLAFGAAAAAALWLAFMAALALYIGATDNFGATYGPLAGTIGVLLWSFLSAIALFVGLSFAAQLEAVRAGTSSHASSATRTHETARRPDRLGPIVQGMTISSDPAESRQALALPDALRLGPAHITVTRLDRSIEFYERAIGLRLHRREPGLAAMGAGGEDLLVLVEEPDARPAGRHAGLYHFALLHPSRLELARAAQRLMATRTPITGASDHGISEAIYLPDPDGNGIELAADRGREHWGDLRDPTTIGPRPLDMAGLLGMVEGEEPREHADPALVIGHVHLHVGDIEQALGFYRDVIGFEVMTRFSSAAFIAAGGYHHHLGLNTWRGEGVPPAPAGVLGLRRWTVVLPEAADVDELSARVAGAELPYEDTEAGLALRDPWNNALLVTTG